MNVHKQEEDELDQFNGRFDILFEVQIHNDPVESEDTNQLQQSKKLELLGWGGIQENQGNVVERNCTEKINSEPTLQVLICDNFSISDLLAAVVINYSRSKYNEDIKYEYKIDNETSHIECLTINAEGNTDWKHEHVVASSQHDEEVPVFLETTGVPYEKIKISYIFHHFNNCLL